MEWWQAALVVVVGGAIVIGVGSALWVLGGGWLVYAVAVMLAVMFMWLRR